jgi:DMSO/TMAO reductase YedYZ molybdopterin-dependent catalytic subunit
MKPARRPTVIPWLDQPADVPPPAQNVVGNLQRWEDLDSWFTPNAKFFTVKHYNLPSIAATSWRLHVSGQVAHRQSVTLAELKSWPRQSVDFTLECSGNTGPPFFISGIGNARWTGTQLRPAAEASGTPWQGGGVLGRRLG